MGKPVMSMIASSEPVSTMRVNRELHHPLGAAGIERADHRHREDAVPQLDDRSRQFEQFLCRRRWMTSSRERW
jgi:hypothetical protein